MAGTWPSIGRLASVPARLRAWRGKAAAPLMGGIALTAVLAAALAFTPSDGTPFTGVVDPVAAAVAFVPEPAVDFTWLSNSLGAHITAPKPPTPIPSAPPATILIASLNVHRPVEPVGVDSSGRMDVPQNLWNAGWYKEGPVPGAPGDAVIEGHAGYPDAPLLFGKLHLLQSGDPIVVVLADGSHQVFLVDTVTVWSPGTSPVDMGTPYGPPRLTLITCTGPFDVHYKTYADRLVVEASYVRPT